MPRPGVPHALGIPVAMEDSLSVSSGAAAHWSRFQASLPTAQSQGTSLKPSDLRWLLEAELQRDASEFEFMPNDWTTRILFRRRNVFPFTTPAGKCQNDILRH